VPRVTLIELVNYRRWTEEIGFDREGLIQVRQSNIYSALQEFFWRNDCFVLPFRYDYYVVISNGLKEQALKELFGRAESIAPYGLRIASAIHKYPAVALEKAFQALKATDFYYENGVDGDNIVIAHIDLNKITEAAYWTGIYESYIEIVKTYSHIVLHAFKYNGLASYLGGDNIVVVLPEEFLEEFLELTPSYVKVGVGISRNARKALELAARALHTIRSTGNARNIIVYRDGASAQYIESRQL